MPEGDFETNRCGFVVLHPAAAAGAAATIEHVDGSREATAFPELIDPWRPFVAIREITHRAGGLDVTCRLEGEEFEMEDQRNWSDASFKTYGRPLELPWPFVLPAGEPVAQSVTVSVRPGRRRAGRGSGRRAVAVEIGAPHGARLPEVGLVVDRRPRCRRRCAALDRLKEIGPQRILCAFDPTAGDGPDALAAFARLQAAYPAAYDLECVVVGTGDLGAELAGVARGGGGRGPAARVRGGLPVGRPAVDAAGERLAGLPAARGVYAAARAAFPGVTLGGGMFSYFTELNRKRPPVGAPRLRDACDEPDRACGGRRQRDGDAGGAAAHHPLDAGDHRRPAVPDRALDDRDAAEPLRRAHAARTRAASGSRWRTTTRASAGASPPPGRRAMPRRSRRPGSRSGCRRPSPGRAGCSTPDGALLPVGEMVRDLARLAGAEVLAAGPLLPRRFAVLAVRSGGGTRALLANLAPEPLAASSTGARTLGPFEVQRIELAI